MGAFDILNHPITITPAIIPTVNRPIVSPLDFLNNKIPAVIVDTSKINNPLVSNAATISSASLAATIEERKIYERNLLQSNNIIKIANSIVMGNEAIHTFIGEQKLAASKPINSEAVMNSVIRVVSPLYPDTVLTDGIKSVKPLPLPELFGKIVLQQDRAITRGTVTNENEPPVKNNWIVPLSFIVLILAVVIK